MPRSSRQATTEDKETQGRVTLIRATALTWLFSGLRSGEISPEAVLPERAMLPDSNGGCVLPGYGERGQAVNPGSASAEAVSEYGDTPR